MDKAEEERVRQDCLIWLKDRFGTVFTGTEYNMDEMMEAFMAGYRQGYSEAY